MVRVIEGKINYIEIGFEGKQKLLRVSRRLHFARVRVIGSQLYLKSPN